MRESSSLGDGGRERLANALSVKRKRFKTSGRNCSIAARARFGIEGTKWRTVSASISQSRVLAEPRRNRPVYASRKPGWRPSWTPCADVVEFYHRIVSRIPSPGFAEGCAAKFPAFTRLTCDLCRDDALSSTHLSPANDRSRIPILTLCGSRSFYHFVPTSRHYTLSFASDDPLCIFVYFAKHLQAYEGDDTLANMIIMWNKTLAHLWM